MMIIFEELERLGILEDRFKFVRFVDGVYFEKLLKELIEEEI